MNDREALYSAILAHPDEDTPRLMFADYLEEHKDAKYAKFIRKQIELAKVPEWDPLWVREWHEDRDAITGNKFEKLAPKLADGLEWPPLTAFRRGFPWQVSTTTLEPFLAHADRLAKAIPLQALEIHADPEVYQSPFDLTPLLASPHLSRMKQLLFSLTRLQRSAIQKLQKSPHIPNLTGLAFEYANVEPLAVPAIFRQPLIGQLESLRFDNCTVSWTALAAGINAVRVPHRLRSFIVEEGSTMHFTNIEIFNAPLLCGLKEFDLSGQNLREENVRALCESPLVNSLESLTLHKTSPGVQGVKAIAECAGFGNLRRLALRLNSLGPVAVKHLAASPHLANLQVLDLETNPLGDKGTIALAESPYLTNLVELDLMHCEVGDAGAEALIKAPFADKLIDLVIHSSSSKVKISDSVRRKLRKKFGDRIFM
ncbi:MAG: TIGR02996 domain-containing protein [Planctomycetia bacterium]|nr:TIGR02996 domain-containing protein [Planctomycetia bacterium]